MDQASLFYGSLIIILLIALLINHFGVVDDGKSRKKMSTPHKIGR